MDDEGNNIVGMRGYRGKDVCVWRVVDVDDGVDGNVDGAFFNVCGDGLRDAGEIVREGCYEVLVCRRGEVVWGGGVADDGGQVGVGVVGRKRIDDGHFNGRANGGGGGFDRGVPPAIGFWIRCQRGLGGDGDDEFDEKVHWVVWGAASKGDGGFEDEAMQDGDVVAKRAAVDAMRVDKVDDGRVLHADEINGKMRTRWDYKCILRASFFRV